MGSSLLHELAGREESDNNDGSISFISVENRVAGSLLLTATTLRRVAAEANAETTAGRGGSTHTGFDRRPRLPFLPMTGVPKCSGLVSGSLSSVCVREMGKLHGVVRVFGGNRMKSQQMSFLLEEKKYILMRKELEMNFAKTR